MFIEASKRLAIINEELYCTIAKQLSRELILRVEDEHITVLPTPKITEFFSLTSEAKIFKSLTLLEGAKEVSFNFSFTGKEDYKSSSIKVDGYSYSVNDG